MTEEYWTKITVNTSPEAVEAVAGILMEAGAGGIEIDDPNIWQESVGTNCYGELYPEIRPISPNAPVKVIAYLAGDCRMVEVIAHRRAGISSRRLGIRCFAGHDQHGAIG